MPPAEMLIQPDDRTTNRDAIKLYARERWWWCGVMGVAF
jgi:hypothetical protein